MRHALDVMCLCAQEGEFVLGQSARSAAVVYHPLALRMMVRVGCMPVRAAPRELRHNCCLLRQVSMPERRLVQFDCGKLQVLARLLAERRAGGHRCLIFTQMSRMLDVLETFLNSHAYTYLRLDGSTGVDERQQMMERFNRDDRVFCFILSTRRCVRCAALGSLVRGRQ